MSPSLVTGLVLSFVLTPAAIFADPLRARHFTPSTHQGDICVDTPLSITFNQAPLVGATGTIRLYRSTDDTLVDSIDLGDPNSAKRPIGGAMAGGNPYLFNYYPVLIDHNTATMYLHRTLDYGETYYVLIDAGVFTDSDDDDFRGIHRRGRWQFTTKDAPPPPGTARLTVDAKGHGDFCTVQGAVDFVPDNNAQRVRIDVRTGTYSEIVYVNSRKPFITVRGEDRRRSVIQYANNNSFNGQVSGLFRAMFGVDASDFVLENITLHNTTPYGGSQAEAFRGYGLHTLLNRVDLSSFQDTLLLQNGGFVTDSSIEGDVDFMWGSGPVFFDRCELKALHAGYYTQIRNPQGGRGNVYLNSLLTRASTLADGTMYLGRIDPTVFPYSEVVFINTSMEGVFNPRLRK